jgi:hypothetical protein
MVLFWGAPPLRPPILLGASGVEFVMFCTCVASNVEFAMCVTFGASGVEFGPGGASRAPRKRRGTLLGAPQSLITYLVRTPSFNWEKQTYRFKHLVDKNAYYTCISNGVAKVQRSRSYGTKEPGKGEAMTKSSVSSKELHNWLKNLQSRQIADNGYCRVDNAISCGSCWKEYFKKKSPEQTEGVMREPL